MPPKTKGGKSKQSQEPTPKRQRVNPTIHEDDTALEDLFGDIPKSSMQIKAELHERFDKMVLPKKVLMEKDVDLELLEKIHLLEKFTAISLHPMLSPPKNMYPDLVKEFYGNFEIIGDSLVKTMVKGRTIIMTAEIIGLAMKIPATGVCPFANKKLFDGFPNLQLKDHVTFCLLPQIVHTDKTSFTLADLTPTSSALLKIIHSNIMPRSSGRDKVTNQDLILLSLILSGTSFNLALLIIKHMESCINHQTKSLPFSGFLATIFEYFGLIFVSDSRTALKEKFDEDLLRASRLVIELDDSLSFIPQIDLTDPVLSESSNLDQNPLFPAILDELKKQTAAITSLSSKIEILASSQMLLRTKIDWLDEKIEKHSKLCAAEFQDLQSGLVRTAAEWDKEILKFHMGISSEIQFVSKQVTAAAQKSNLTPWNDKRDWIADKDISEVHQNLPLPAIPPASFFWLTREEYLGKLITWLEQRDDQKLKPVDLTKKFLMDGSSSASPF